MKFSNNFESFQETEPPDFNRQLIPYMCTPIGKRSFSSIKLPSILKTINHMLERGSKVFSCFLDVRKAFDTVWIDGLLYKLFNDLGIKGRMWLAIKDLYTDVKAQVLYSG